MIGGENLLDKSQQQERFLQNALHELEAKENEQKKLRNSLSSIVVSAVYV